MALKTQKPTQYHGLLPSILHFLYESLLYMVLWILEKVLLADITDQKHLDDLEAEDLTGPKSAKMKDKNLRINIQADGVLHNEADDEVDPPSSADIEVIHKKALPRLHSILKQRTISESSDDPGCTSSSGESPRSTDEASSPEAHPKKSVTFNQHIDSATYKKNAAPTSMKATLKGKRRRARKKEEKKANGRRRRNSGSEGSSGEELSHTEGEEGMATDKAEFENIQEDVEGEKKSEEKVMRKKEVPAVVRGSVLVGKDNQDFRTSVGMSTSDKKKEIVEAVTTKMATLDLPEAEDSDDDVEESDNGNNLDERTSSDHQKKSLNGKVSEMGEKNDLKESDTVGVNAESVTNGDSGSSNVENESYNKMVLPKDSDTIDASTLSQHDSGIEDSVNMGDNSPSTDGNEVETVLSWKANGDGADKHKTECAFSFSNSVIYDLDID